jgi:hypothetical protein
VTEPPPNPLADDLPLVTRAELDRVTAIRRVAPWYREPAVVDRVGPEGDAAFLLGLVDRLLGRALLPGEDLYSPENPADRVTVTSGPSLYMCGHGDWHVHLRGRPGIVLSLTAGPLDVARLRDLLAGRYPPATGDAAR